MLNDPRDTGAYRIAVGAIGLALVVVLGGLCVIVAVGITDIPKELWTITSALGGGLLGLLAPSPTPSSAKDTPLATGDTAVARGLAKVNRSWAILAKDIWTNRSVVILLVIFVAAVVFGAANGSSQFQALAAASGAALIGLLAPGTDKTEH